MADAVSVTEAQKNASPEVKAIAKFLRGKDGPRIRRGLLNDKRVDYFKGKSAVKALLGPAYKKQKNVPAVETDNEANAMLTRAIQSGFFIRTDRPELATPTPPGQPKPLRISPQQSFSTDAYYTWFTSTSSLAMYLGSIAMVIVLFAGVMFPLWPASMRLGVYYLSVGVMWFIGAFIAMAVGRLIGWMGTSLVMKHGIWLFPNLFEDVGVIDSFKPLWGWDIPPEKKSKKSKSTPSNLKPKSGKSKKSSSQLDLPATSIDSSASASPSPSPSPVPGPASVSGSGSGSGLGDAPSTAAGTGPSAGEDAAMHLGGEGNMRKRQQAYVEDVGEDE